MYLFSFYLFFWSVGALMLVPVCVSWVAYQVVVARRNAKQFTIDDMLGNIEAISSQDEFNSSLHLFKEKYGIIRNRRSLDVWFSCIQKLIGYRNYWSTDQIAAFGHELEKLNEYHAKKISNVVSGALKLRDVKS